MAGTPKRSLKRTVASTVEDRTPQFLLGWLVIAMIVSLLAGLGIGMKVGEHHKATKKLASLTTPTTRHTGKKPATRRAVLANAPLVGTVASLGAKSMVIVTTKGRVVIGLIKLTAVDTVAPANGSDVKAGRRIRLQFAAKALTPTTTGTTAAGAPTTAKPPATLTAKEILLMPTTSKIGSVVTAATPESVTVTISGKAVVVSTTGTTFDKAVTATRADLKKGSRVLVRVLRKSVKVRRRTRRVTTALEIVVLPPGSTIT